MATLPITEIDDKTMQRLERRAQREGRTVEDVLRDVVAEAVSNDASDRAEESFLQDVERLRQTPSDQRYPDIEPVEIEGISASELLIRDRRRL